MDETKNLQLTDEEIGLLHWMAGYSSLSIPKVLEETFDGLMKKLGETLLIEEAES